MLQLSGLLIVLFLTVLVRRSPGIGWGLIAALLGLASDFPFLSALSGACGGIAVYPEDALAVILALASLPKLAVAAACG